MKPHTGSATANGIERKSYLDQVFHFKLGSFTVMKEVLAQILDRVFNFKHGYVFALSTSLISVKLLNL
jgi:hypothetical protein